MATNQASESAAGNANQSSDSNGHSDGRHSSDDNGTSAQAEKTGINVIVVGAGFGGLAAAIECHLQGHNVTVYESFAELKVLGDIISFGANAGKLFRRWRYKNGDRVSDRLDPLSIKLQNHGFRIHKYTGEFVICQKSPPRNEEAPVLNGHRGEFHEILFNYAKNELGIPIHLGTRINKYFETPTEAGIILASGEKTSADVVIGSDGVRSKARELVLGYVDKPKSSGYAVFRAWFSNEKMLADPETRRFCENGDTFQGWIGPDVHFLFSTIKNGSDCCWVLTHKDDADIDESWSFPGKLEDVYKVFEGWDPLCKTIVSKTPEEKLVDWKLVYRDPLPRWVSDEGRITLLGDSAHPFLPTSAQGATQALEDGVTIAVTLKAGGKDRVPAAVRAFQDIRYDRASAIQKTGEAVRDMWHKADWDKVAQNPESIQMPREDWIHGHNAYTHAEKEAPASIAKFA